MHQHAILSQACLFNMWKLNRYVMEALADAIALVENSNGGKLKPSKMFKRLESWLRLKLFTHVCSIYH